MCKSILSTCGKSVFIKGFDVNIQLSWKFSNKKKGIRWKAGDQLIKSNGTVKETVKGSFRCVLLGQRLCQIFRTSLSPKLPENQPISRVPKGKTAHDWMSESFPSPVLSKAISWVGGTLEHSISQVPVKSGYLPPLGHFTT